MTRKMAFAPFAGDKGLPIVNPVAQYLFAHPELYPLAQRVPTDGLLASNFQGKQTSFVKNNQEDFKVDWTPGNCEQDQWLLFTGHRPRWVHGADTGLFPVAECLPDTRWRSQLGAHFLADDR